MEALLVNILGAGLSILLGVKLKEHQLGAMLSDRRIDIIVTENKFGWFETFLDTRQNGGVNVESSRIGKFVERETLLDVDIELLPGETEFTVVLSEDEDE